MSNGKTNLDLAEIKSQTQVKPVPKLGGQLEVNKAAATFLGIPLVAAWAGFLLVLPFAIYYLFFFNSSTISQAQERVAVVLPSPIPTLPPTVRRLLIIVWSCPWIVCRLSIINANKK